MRDWFTKHHNACRCTGYKPIVDAVMDAASVLRGEMSAKALEYQLPADGRIWGGKYPRQSAVGKVTGTLDYGQDLSLKMPPDTLRLALVQAKVSHANILSIDTSEAEKMPGVYKVVTHKDVKGKNRITGLITFPTNKGDGWDRPILCDTKVFQYGDAIAIVCADTEANARAAADKVKVELEVLPAYMNAPDAMADDAIEIHPGTPNVYYEQGVVKGEETKPLIASAPYVAEGSFFLQGQPHMTVESDVGFAYFDDEGRLTIHSKSIGLYLHLYMIAPGLGIEPEKLRMVLNPAGGTFGYKFCPTMEALLGVACMATGRPVYLKYDYQQYMTYTGKRSPFFVDMKLAADEKGKLVAMETDWIVDHGPYSEFADLLTLRGAQFMGALCKQARQTMVAQNRMPPSAHDFALRDMEFSHSDKFTMARHQLGTETSDYLFFPGCQLSASAPEQVEQVYAYLRARLPGAGLMLRCCGAPADWAGRTDLFQASLAEFSTWHTGMGRPRVILACSSCYQIFKTNLPDVEIVSLWQLFEQLGLPEGVNRENGRVVSVHDPCSTRHERQMHESVRRVLTQLGYQIEKLPLNREKTTCCSYGGVMWLANPELAREVVERRLAANPADYVTYCAMCRDFFAARGKRTLHLLDLLFGGNREARAARRGPGYSQRHENRARLKQKLLKEVWGETMDGQESYEAIKLIISAEVQQRLEDRLILVEDIQRVIEYAERTGHKLHQPKTGHLLAHHRPTSVTYWVEYSPQEDAFVVHNAYSHRMEIAEDVKP